MKNCSNSKFVQSIQIRKKYICKTMVIKITSNSKKPNEKELINRNQRKLENNKNSKSSELHALTGRGSSYLAH
jgi:hypothetical protein